MKKICEIIEGKHVLFISTKNKDYIRNQQEIHFLKQYAGIYEEIVFQDKSYIKRVLKVLFDCCRGNGKKADVIFIGFAPQLLLFFLCRWTKQKTVIIDFFISFYDTFVCDRKYFREGLLISKILHWIDEKSLKYCNYIVADTHADAKYFSEEFHVKLSKITVYYLEADKNVYSIEKYKPKIPNNKISILYFGSILPLQGIDMILESTQLLRKQEDIEFIIVGPIRNKRNWVDRRNYPNVTFYNWLSQEELAKHIAQADLCLAGHFNAEIEKAKRTIPGKAYIYEAMGKKMILGDNPANRELFPEDDRHFYVKMGDAKKLAEKILKLKATIIHTP